MTEESCGQSRFVNNKGAWEELYKNVIKETKKNQMVVAIGAESGYPRQANIGFTTCMYNT